MNQDTLFPLPQPELKLEVEDAATSDDPLEIFLQRRGWDLSGVKELQMSIATKLTISFITGGIEELSGAEVELQTIFRSS